jgi:osmotically-inducible protein OsmY
LQAAGFVKNKDQQTKISKILSRFDKEYHIYNHTVIVSDNATDVDDWRLKNSIEMNLRNLNYPVSDVDIQTCKGKVILSGFVDKQVDLDEIGNVVSNTKGVHKIYNHLLYKS